MLGSPRYASDPVFSVAKQLRASDMARKHTVFTRKIPDTLHNSQTPDP
jgi:hypothetical protein